jgi:hypothetical protein
MSVSVFLLLLLLLFFVSCRIFFNERENIKFGKKGDMPSMWNIKYPKEFIYSFYFLIYCYQIIIPVIIYEETNQF